MVLSTPKDLVVEAEGVVLVGRLGLYVALPENCQNLTFHFFTLSHSRTLMSLFYDILLCSNDTLACSYLMVSSIYSPMYHRESSFLEF